MIVSMHVYTARAAEVEGEVRVGVTVTSPTPPQISAVFWVRVFGCSGIRVFGCSGVWVFWVRVLS